MSKMARTNTAIRGTQPVGQSGLATVETNDGAANQGRIEIGDDKIVAEVKGEEHQVSPGGRLDSLPDLGVEKVQPLGMHEK
jgi:hypothetical protein